MSELLGLEARNVVKSFTDRPVIDGLTIDVKPGEFAVILGPSGCGKTTLLRCLSGLTQTTSGEVLIGGTAINGVPDDVAVVFQEYNKSLYPWLSLEANVRFGLGHLDKAEAKERAKHALERVGLADAAHLHPWEVSGGMQQRAAIARALAAEAGLLIMDEPFASVDAITKIHLEELLLKIWSETPFTCIFVTHDIEEAVFMADRLFVLTERPTKVLKEFEVDLPRPRDPLTTKALPRFRELREEAFGLIEGVGSRQAAS